MHWWFKRKTSYYGDDDNHNCDDYGYTSYDVKTNTSITILSLSSIMESSSSCSVNYLLDNKLALTISDLF